MQRINRFLSNGDLVLKAGRGHAQKQLGSYYLLDRKEQCVFRTNVNLSRLGRNIGVFPLWEEVVD